jgi:hypothetical protein
MAAPATPRQPQPDPFREAELANATRRTEVEPPRSRGPSLISKVTGLGRLLGGGHPVERRAEPVIAPAPVAPQRTATRAAEALRQPAVAPAPRAAASQPARPAPAQPAPEARPAQPRLNLDTTDRRSASMSDEHLLDIPAFLRRQAN